MDFLPKNYKEPDTSNYMRLKQGDNRFRVLSSAITGMELWKTTENGRKPVRFHMDEKIPIKDLEEDKEGNLVMPKTFWAFVVWNYQSEKIQILELTQTTIRKKILALTKNKAWGNPREYDITITREGDGFDTNYTVMPNPKKEFDKGIIKLAKDMNINLNALYDGEDPFKNNKTNNTEDKRAEL